jgi:hypothetical protein
VTIAAVVTAPAAPGAGGSVRLHATTNAGNDDDSPLGDYVYAVGAVSRSR